METDAPSTDCTPPTDEVSQNTCSLFTTEQCVLCSSKITENSMECHVCSKKVHLSCVYPSLDATLVKIGTLLWCCNDCSSDKKSEKQFLKYELTKIEEMLSHVNQEVMKFRSRVESSDSAPTAATASHLTFAEILKSKRFDLRSREPSQSSMMSDSSQKSKKRKSFHSKNETADPKAAPTKQRTVKPAPIIAVGDGAANSNFKAIPPRKPNLPRRYIGMAQRETTTDDIKQHCTGIGVELLHIREVSKQESPYKSFHAVFQEKDIEEIEKAENWPQGILIGRFRLNETAWQWLKNLPRS